MATWDVNLDAHYQFFFGRGFRAYPLLGLTVVGYHIPFEGLDFSLSKACFGINIGGGAQYDINKDWAVYTEVKGQIVHDSGSRFGWSVGGAYKF